MSASDEKASQATVKDKTYTRGGLIFIFLFDDFVGLALSLVYEPGCRNDFVMSEINVNLVVLNRENNLVDIDIELYGIVINRMWASL